MFGNLKPTSLTGCSKGRYQASFCGGCQAMAELGRPWALATGYDIAFLHFLMASLEGAETELRPCTALPFKKLPVRRLRPRSRRWLTAVNMLLIEEKCRDDVRDENGWTARLGLSLVKNQGARARAVLQEEGLSPQTIIGLSERQAKAESACAEPEEYALPTSILLGEIFAHAAVVSERPELSTPMRQLGQGLGSAIYLKDATDDRRDDQRRGRFNALSSSGQSDGYAHLALYREVRRARCGLSRLGLGADGISADLVLDELLPKPGKVSSVATFRQGRERGVCELLLCCDLAVCCQGATCCDAAALATCCPCEACCLCTSGEGKRKDFLGPEKTPARVPLHCPACGNSLEARNYENVEIDECRICYGIWLDRGELEALAHQSFLPERLLKPKAVMPMQTRPEGTRPCPRCSKLLVGTMAKGVRIDLCAECQGMWLDQGELNELLRDRAE